MGTVYAKEAKFPVQQNEDDVDLTTVPANVKNVHVDGLGRTKDDFIVSEVKSLFKADNFQDMVFRAQEIKKKLEKHGIFRNVGIFIDTSKGTDPTGYDVTFEVTEVRRIIGGINTLIGNNDASLLFALKFPNAFGRAELFGIDYTHGTKQSSGYNVNFSKPFELNHEAKFSASIYETHGEYPWSGYKETDKGVNVDVSFPSKLGFHNINWEGVWRELQPMSKTTAFAVREQCGHSLKSSVKHILTRDLRDNPVIPTEGTLIRLIQEYAGLGGDIEFMKHDLELQANTTIWDTTFQVTLAGGLMKSLNPEKGIALNDRFFLGGPMTLRGFNMKGVGPHSDGGALGAESYWLAGLHMYTPLPFRPGQGGFGDLFRTHFFVNAGNLTSLDFNKDLRQNIELLSRAFRLAYGAGIVLRMGRIARLELNYCVPVRCQQEDSVNCGLQFGIGVSFQ